MTGDQWDREAKLIDRVAKLEELFQRLCAALAAEPKLLIDYTGEFLRKLEKDL